MTSACNLQPNLLCVQGGCTATKLTFCRRVHCNPGENSTLGKEEKGGGGVTSINVEYAQLILAHFLSQAKHLSSGNKECLVSISIHAN